MEIVLNRLLAEISLLTVIPDIYVGFPEYLVVPRQVDSLDGQAVSSTSSSCRFVIIAIRFLLDSNSG
jgi:hypothetical protein